MPTRSKAEKRNPFADTIIPDLRPGQEPAQMIRDIPLAHIKPNPEQFRQSFNTTTIRELANSIAEQGLIEPLVVRPVGEDKFEVVAGERRRQALMLLAEENSPGALTAVPVTIRNLDDTQAAMIIATENLQREDFSIVDEAVMYERLITALRLDPERGGRELARRLGIDFSRVNRVRRLARHPALLSEVNSGELTMKHALERISRMEQLDTVGGALIEAPTPEQMSDLMHGASSSTEIENSARIFTEQHVSAHTRKVPGKAWQPFYGATDHIRRFVESNPGPLMRQLAAEDRQDIISRALQAREQLDRLIDALGTDERASQ